MDKEIEQEFSAVKKQLLTIDKRFEQVDKRFDKIEQRLDYADFDRKSIWEAIKNVDKKSINGLTKSFIKLTTS
ncbi:hypothetical protein CO057_01725 [Candidatus Uhrbacteria bacterium CG_4_9_14_0_2_um_filter_41_50]|uniref:Uncharacterized protein n=1 Tax=Candidatus Uhrbacteria bacterium CG_4_9_14_0_2_um_filter_41_50 TaxID=1975031 RepID=A0A2M8EPP2_9BACT|nr:MAG: hypothetical protein COZ45_00905 [Candidatus Uhrbacteria bacterium CG_4_10_14_3_um_filter_41_21]PIZ55416.1 MAG: hypothetical protein COY24_00410 [Candidatus Uhrbacteria bacterium CG_4_10_14_0_2_um_filter_41_21]PJB84960.1 MAG: hypothetical protein CO086_00755 [Candidatus Uhrbacteria bacterium CG_4_9_14_0_8_um_filter_41_16]PJC24647.1 MAG: hypothetical protein CO057_01725 [Candidatus Uhrbacteria bacterium CG_4_9_14_0_2_um_filter_41_50]PJE75189.1 MAG: hypothetical protein COV03_01465 [Candi